MPQSLIHYPSLRRLACVDLPCHSESDGLEVGLCTRCKAQPYDSYELQRFHAELPHDAQTHCLPVSYFLFGETWPRGQAGVAKASDYGIWRVQTTMICHPADWCGDQKCGSLPLFPEERLLPSHLRGSNLLKAFLRPLPCDLLCSYFLWSSCLQLLLPIELHKCLVTWYRSFTCSVDSKYTTLPPQWHRPHEPSPALCALRYPLFAPPLAPLPASSHLHRLLSASSAADTLLRRMDQTSTRVTQQV
jgi:hypothetical protein